MTFYRHPERPGKLYWHAPVGIPFITAYPGISFDGQTATIYRAAFGGVWSDDETFEADGADVFADLTDNGDGTYSYVFSGRPLLLYTAGRAGMSARHKAWGTPPPPAPTAQPFSDGTFFSDGTSWA